MTSADARICGMCGRLIDAPESVEIDGMIVPVIITVEDRGTFHYACWQNKSQVALDAQLRPRECVASSDGQHKINAQGYCSWCRLTPEQPAPADAMVAELAEVWATVEWQHGYASALKDSQQYASLHSKRTSAKAAFAAALAERDKEVERLKVALLEAEDVAGDFRRASLIDRIAMLEAALDEVIGCFDAAEVEGLGERLAGQPDHSVGSLPDLFHRRIYYAKQAAMDARAAALSKPAQEGKKP